ncbi:YceI family protein [Robertkochia marina]|uniref:YceI family protein n=1 Tax=Robertkochia marina TaxID=1227945 RepID=A0A4S3M2V0_9FLAO|nr:YceI family protein [Robertkochia marina]THD69200.1 YceI family protein [Robertkochia marina]TRZ47541.1 YceI family protein [Robertkochia marina]
MRSNISFYQLTGLVFLLFLSGLLKSVAQQYTLDNIRSVTILTGTTNHKDWQLNVKEHKGSLLLENNGTRVLSSLYVEIPVMSLKGNKKGMEKDAYKAMKAETHPNVSFSLTAPVALEPSVDNTYNIIARGDLSISGITKPIELRFTLTRTTNGVDLEGEKSIDMTEFGIEPPKAFWGLLKVNKEVTVKFTTTFLK